MITESDWVDFESKGYLHLGRLLEGSDLRSLQNRIDAIMLGEADIDYDRLLMQLDSKTGEYEDMGEQTNGHKGATLAYRKIQNLEIDPLFGAYVARPLFRDICQHIYGPEVPIACFRAMFMNKPSHQGTKLPWHQDAWTDLDRQPLITVWTALDPATRENGCVEVIPGSHKEGLVNPEHNSGFLSREQVEARVRRDQVEHLELAPGEVVLLHNWLLHSSDVNRSATSRRAFSVCYMDARTVHKSGHQFTRLFESAAV